MEHEVTVDTEVDYFPIIKYKKCFVSVIQQQFAKSLKKNVFTNKQHVMLFNHFKLMWCNIYRASIFYSFKGNKIISLSCYSETGKHKVPPSDENTNPIEIFFLILSGSFLLALDYVACRPNTFL